MLNIIAALLGKKTGETADPEPQTEALSNIREVLRGTAGGERVLQLWDIYTLRDTQRPREEAFMAFLVKAADALANGTPAKPGGPITAPLSPDPRPWWLKGASIQMHEPMGPQQALCRSLGWPVERVVGLTHERAEKMVNLSLTPEKYDKLRGQDKRGIPGLDFDPNAKPIENIWDQINASALRMIPQAPSGPHVSVVTAPDGQKRTFPVSAGAAPARALETRTGESVQVPASVASAIEKWVGPKRQIDAIRVVNV